jgi:hypothetical protein
VERYEAVLLASGAKECTWVLAEVFLLLTAVTIFRVPDSLSIDRQSGGLSVAFAAGAARLLTDTALFQSTIRLRLGEHA